MENRNLENKKGNNRFIPSEKEVLMGFSQRDVYPKGRLTPILRISDINELGEIAYKED